MKKLLTTLCLMLAVLIGSTGVSYALPSCPHSKTSPWSNCFGTFTFANGNKYVGEFKDGKPHGQGTNTYARKTAKPKPKVIVKRQPKKSKPKQRLKTGTSGSCFFISKLGHIITNQHVVDKCSKVTVGDNAKKQVATNVVETDRRNDLALLRIKNMKMASVETKSLIRKLGISVVPLATEGLLRSKGVELGENIMVAGYSMVKYSAILLRLPEVS